MGKNEQGNGYEKYSQYFETIESMCDDKHFVEETPELLAGRHYILDNGLHVFKGNSHTFISDLDLSKSRSTLRYFEMAKYNNGHCINLYTGSCGLISYVQRGSDLNQGLDSYFLPSDLTKVDEDYMRKNLFFVELPADMRELLQEAVEKAENATTKEEYKSAIRLHDAVLDMLRGVEQSQEEQKFDELGNLSPEQLEERLRIIRYENNEKKKELRRQELIKQILEAQQEGENLDSQIANAKAEIANNR